MPRILTGAGLIVALLAPSLAFAAAADVTLTTDTVLTVNGITLNVSGSSATIESMTVNTGNVSVTLQSGSSFQVSAPGLEQLSADVTTGQTNYVCNGSQSLIKYVPTSMVTVVITPSSTLCSSAGGSTNSTTVSTTASPGGGGGGSSTPATSVTQTATTTVVATTPAVTTTPAATAPVTTPASGLTSEQATSILSLLASFGADSATIAKVQAVLLGTGSTGASALSSGSFARNLDVGATGSDVKALQVFLNSHGYVVAASGAGSPGKETTKFGRATRAALIKYQKANGITPAAGYFGPKTRAAVNAAS